jgi:hypothetical protein
MEARLPMPDVPLGKRAMAVSTALSRRTNSDLNLLYIQAKRWDNTIVGSPEIQKFVGALHGKKANLQSLTFRRKQENFWLEKCSLPVQPAETQLNLFYTASAFQFSTKFPTTVFPDQMKPCADGVELLNPFGIVTVTA